MLKKTSILMMAFFLCTAGACANSALSSEVSEKAQSTYSENTVKYDAAADTDEVSVQDKADTAQESESSISSEASANGSSDTTEESTSSTADETVSSADISEKSSSGSTNNSTKVYTANTDGKLDTADLFSDRDLTQSPDLSGASTINAENNKTVTISEEGTYILTGTASEFTVKVDTDKQNKVQIVLDNANITNTSTPVIYVVSADKCFVTTAAGTSTLSVTGSFTADGDTNTDAVIYSKDDLVLNGKGTLVIDSSENGISGKDDIKITGGTYEITSNADSIEANDSIAVYVGTFTFNTSKDALHSENDDDDTVGWIYIQNGSFTINASSDGIQAATVVQIDGGSYNITSSEGIEATYVQINGGDISITASDDGINASTKSKSMGTPVVEVNGGSITIVMGQGDTDAIDANGNIIVNGGTINITAQVSSFDYDGTAEYNGGTIITNGSQVDSIPQSMMGGGGMGGMGGFQGRGGRMF